MAIFKLLNSVDAFDANPNKPGEALAQEYRRFADTYMPYGPPVTIYNLFHKGFPEGRFVHSTVEYWDGEAGRHFYVIGQAINGVHGDIHGNLHIPEQA